MLGYIGLISEEELERYGEDVYDLNDKIGKSGTRASIRKILFG
jgi:cell division protein FtsI/penicillin-binding protein 2